MLLVVEDERHIQDLLEISLTDAGFEVVTASDGTEAIAELDAASSRCRAVITDIKLGAGPKGWEVARHARMLVPDMPIVYVTGDSGHEWPSQGVPNSVLVVKPFALSQIITAISALLTDADAHRASTADGC